MSETKEYREEYRELNGICQYILHYPAAQDRKPVLLMVGNYGCDTAYAYLSAPVARRMFHLVCYDRRGTGKTLLASPPQTKAATCGELYRDLEETASYIMEQYQTERLVLLGQGLGSVLTARYLAEHPANVSYYIGAGQYTCPADYEKARCMAMELVFNMKGQMKNVLFMSSIHSDTGGTYRTELLPRGRRLRLRIMQRGMGMFGFGGGKRLRRFAKGSPAYDNAADRLITQALRQTKQLCQSPEVMDFKLEELAIPKETRGLFISGRRDFSSPYTLVREYWEHLFAGTNPDARPAMKLELLPDMGEALLYEEPVAFWACVWKNYQTDREKRE